MDSPGIAWSSRVVASPESQRVLHVCSTLLQRTETFIQQRLHGRRFAPVALAWKRVDEGLDVPCPWMVVPSNGERRWLPSELRRLDRKARHHWRLLRIVRGAAPTVVHAHFGPTALQVDRECRLLGIPLVVSFYGYDAGSAPRDPVFRRGYRRLFRMVGAVTAEGPVLAQRLVELGADPSRVKLLPLSLPGWALREPQRAIGVDDAVLHLIQIARFVEKKAVDTTLRAVASARAAGVSVRLTLIGDGPLRSQVDALVAELRLAAAIERPGFVGYDALPARLGAAHVLVQPSRTSGDGDTEGGAPTILVEAQAQGLPVLATNHADIPNVVRHGRTALLTPEGDHEALAASIVQLARDRTLLARLAAEARPFALRRHDPEKLIALRERIYLDAIRRVRSHLGPMPSSPGMPIPANRALPAAGVRA